MTCTNMIGFIVCGEGYPKEPQYCSDTCWIAGLQRRIQDLEETLAEEHQVSVARLNAQKELLDERSSLRRQVHKLQEALRKAGAEEERLLAALISLPKEGS